MMRRITFLTVAVLCLVAAARTVQAGYLSAVGPAPLRFHDRPAAAKSPLPPLPADKPVTPVSMPPATPAAHTGASPASPAATTSAVGAGSTNEVVITPQMLVEFFRARTGNGTDRQGSVYVPFNFAPPSPAAQPSSHATYEVR